jgi:hypothetical protein
MSWKIIQSSDVEAELLPAELQQLNALEGATTLLDNILIKTINRVRGQIKAGGNQLDIAGTIPDQLESEVIAIARWRWLISFPELESIQTPARQKAHDDAEAVLKEISSNRPERPRVELPAQPDTTAAPTNAVAVGRPGRKIDTCSFDKMGQT